MTRKEYMNTPGPEAHRTYYRQFVSHRTVAVVVRVIGAERLLGSTDPDFRDIPLKEWDGLPPPPAGGLLQVSWGLHHTRRVGLCR